MHGANCARKLLKLYLKVSNSAIHCKIVLLYCSFNDDTGKGEKKNPAFLFID